VLASKYGDKFERAVMELNELNQKQLEVPLTNEEALINKFKQEPN
jgi:hypothetical protein